MASIRIEKKNGKMDLASREIMENWYKNLPDGCHEITTKEVSDIHYTPTRYKYWFDCVMQLALPVCKKYFFWFRNGEEIPLKDAEDLHEFLKGKYNPVYSIDKTDGTMNLRGGTTTLLSDREFISNFEQQVIADLSGPPFNLFIPEREEWRDMRETFSWEDFKENYFEQLESEIA